MKKIPLVEMYRGGDVRRAAASVLESGWYIKGPHGESFERSFARFCSAREACVVNSGTSALMLIMEALGVGRGDEIIMPSHTFIATATPVIHRGARPVFVDVDPVTYNLDPKQVEGKIGPRTAGIIAVHLYGHPANMEPLQKLAAKHGLFLVEDACQAHGATYNRRKVGSLGTAAAFSFFPSKNMTVGGDGGAVVSSDPELVETCRTLRDQGRLRGEKYLHHMAGYNFRLSEILCAVGEVQLKHLPDWISARRKVASMYGRELKGTDEVTLPAESKGSKHVYYVYTIRVPAAHRDALRSHLSSRGIATGLYYPVPVHAQPAITGGKRPARLPVTDALVEEILSLPMHPKLKENDVRRICREISGYFAGKA